MNKPVLKGNGSYSEYAEGAVGNLLWGYPALVNKIHEDLRPALIAARKKRRRKKEEAEQQETTTEHVDNGPEGVAEDLTDTTSVPPAPLDDRSGPLVTTQSDAQSNIQGQPDYHPPICDEDPLLTATSASTKALEPTPSDPVLKPDIGEGATSSNETGEVASTSVSNNKELRVPQSEEEPRV